MMDQMFAYVVLNIKHIWVIMWHIFTNSTNNTTTILFPTQLWELLYTYHVIKQCTEKEEWGSNSQIQLQYNHDGSSSVKMKGNCFIDIDGIYDYLCL
jgi:hypothetical protein